MNNLTFTLLGTSACHLCEEAHKIINNIITNESVIINPHCNLVDIIDDDQLYEKYSLRIPVLLIKNNNKTIEINWPFTEEEIKNKMIENNSRF